VATFLLKLNEKINNILTISDLVLKKWPPPLPQKPIWGTFPLAYQPEAANLAAC
jgi:hypothetical protein